MDKRILAEERAYWIEEAAKRKSAIQAARVSNLAPHLLAAAELRLREAEERLASMQ